MLSGKEIYSLSTPQTDKVILADWEKEVQQPCLPELEAACRILQSVASQCSQWSEFFRTDT